MFDLFVGWLCCNMLLFFLNQATRGLEHYMETKLMALMAHFIQYQIAVIGKHLFLPLLTHI